jgi:predicted GNAT family N-acyltransferase
MNQSLGMRRFQSSAPDGLVSVHDPISPAEIYSGQPVIAFLRPAGPDSPYSIRLNVFRLTPLGIEIDVTSIYDKIEIVVGSELDVRVHVANQICEFFGVAVATLHEDVGRILLGVRLCQSPIERSSAEDRRRDARWLCGSHFLPTGVAPNPAKFNDFVNFSVVDISAKGMQLSTSLRNKFLIGGMVLDASVSFPLIGQVKLHLRIENARIRSTEGRDYLGLGVTVLEHDRETLETIGQYLLQFGPGVTVSELRSSGFMVESTDSSVTYTNVKTIEDYRSVLALRQLAYSKVGKAELGQSIEKMSDIYDSSSRIIMSQHFGKTIGSLRLTFHTPEESNEYDHLVHLPPEQFPRRDEIVVLSRICTDPSYRGSDLFYGLMRQCVQATVQSNRRYLLGGCSDSLLPLYKKVGFKPTGIYFTHTNLKDVQEQIILADAHAILSGSATSLSVWNELYHDLTAYLSEVQDLSFDPRMNFRLGIYRSLAPITRLFTGGVRKPRQP